MLTCECVLCVWNYIPTNAAVTKQDELELCWWPVTHLFVNDEMAKALILGSDGRLPSLQLMQSHRPVGEG